MTKGKQTGRSINRQTDGAAGRQAKRQVYRQVIRLVDGLKKDQTREKLIVYQLESERKADSR